METKTCEIIPGCVLEEDKKGISRYLWDFVYLFGDMTEDDVILSYVIHQIFM